MYNELSQLSLPHVVFKTENNEKKKLKTNLLQHCRPSGSPYYLSQFKNLAPATAAAAAAAAGRRDTL